MSNELLEKLAEFVKSWREAATEEGIEFIDIQVNLASVLSDICERAEIEPSQIGMTEKELV